MICRCSPIASAAALLSLSLFEPSTALARPPRRLGLQQAVALAMRNSLDLKQAQQQLHGATAKRKTVRGGLLPTISVETSLLVWDKALTFELPEMPIPGLEFDLGNVRDQVTHQTTLQLVQPITPIYQIYQGYRAAKHGERAARYQIESTRQQTIAAVKTSYIQLKQAAAGVAIARAALAQVETQLRRARAFQRAGLLGRNDVLKLEVAKARARAGLLRTKAGSTMAQTALAVKLGLPPSSTIVATESFADPPPRFKRTFAQCLARALAARTEVSALRAQAAAAEAGTRVALGAMFPQLAAIGAYQRSDGMGFAYPKNAFFVGASLKWDWSWGAKYYGLEEARTQARRAALGQRQLRDGIHLQLKKSYLELRTARQALDVARVAIAQAEESFRIEQTKYAKSSATTTDVINAQLSLTRARQAYNNALYGWYIARAALDRAMGTGKTTRRR